MIPRMRFQAKFLSLSRTFFISNKYFGPLKVRDRKILLYFVIFFPLGYGHIACQSALGKIVTMLYALVCIPITTMALYYSSNIVLSLVQIFIIFIEHRLLKRQQITRYQRKIFVTQIVLLSACFTFQCITVAPFVVDSDGNPVSDWLSIFYFNFITFCTIGFGDYNMDYLKYFRPETIKKNPEYPVIYMVCSVNVYVLMGLVASLLNFLANCTGSKDDKAKENASNKY